MRGPRGWRARRQRREAEAAARWAAERAADLAFARASWLAYTQKTSPKGCTPSA